MGAIRDAANLVFREFRKWSEAFPLPIGDPRSGVQAVSKNDIRNIFTQLDGAVAGKADLESPSFTGAPLVPTAATNENSGIAASTAWVLQRVAEAVLSAGSGDVVSPGAATLWQRVGAASATGRLLQFGRTVELVDRIEAAPSLDLQAADLAAMSIGTRLGGATFRGESGSLQVAAPNVPRVQYDAVTRQAASLLLEPTRTNLLMRSQELGTSPWSLNDSLTVTANTTAAPDGTLTADTISDGGANYGNLTQSVTVAANSTAYTLSVFFRKSGTGPTSASLRFYFTGGTQVSTSLEFNVQTGAKVGGTGAVEDVGGGWCRASMTLANNGSNTAAMAQIYPAPGASGDAADIVMWGWQLEAGQYPTSYIATTSAMVTRAGDDFKLPVDADWFNNIEGTLVVDVTLLGDHAGGSNPFMTIENAIGDFITLRNGSGTDFIGYVGASWVLDTADVATVAGGRMRFAIAYKLNDYAFIANGAVIDHDTSAAVPANVTSIRFAAGYRVHRVSYWPSRLSDLNMQILTVA